VATRTRVAARSRVAARPQAPSRATPWPWHPPGW
jgi:hypothetical protein